MRSARSSGSGGYPPRDRTRTSLDYHQSGDRPAPYLPPGTKPNVPHEMRPQGEYVWGVSPVISALKARRREPYKLFLFHSPGNRVAFSRIEGLAREANVPVVEADKTTLNAITRNGVHQGVVLDASPLSYSPLLELPPPEGTNARSSALWLALDEVTDPQNMGAILRSAAYFGADGVVVSETKTAPLTSVVSKASAGAMELLTVHQASDLRSVLLDGKEKGWHVVGTGTRREAAPSPAVSLTRPTVLVLGNEGDGVRPHILNICETVSRIPRPPSSLVPSLNVSVATGIFLYQLLYSRLAAVAAEGQAEIADDVG